jgi:16S rRNA (adenine1518-N6/adenine1519-N6)-dimethyltransferase
MITLKKSLGQNFLKDNNVINKIVNTVKIKDRNIIEIGPGDGALTEQIVKLKPKTLILIEKDFNLFEKLKIKYKQKKFIKIFCYDFLKFNLESVLKKDTIIFGNLPYNISSQIFVKLLKFEYWPPKYSDLILMFQKELGEKIIASFPSSKYGRLSILTNLMLDLEKKFLVSPNCFKPKPKVNSIVIHLKPKLKKIINLKNINNLEKITNIFFSNKRKMINKNIKKILNKDEINLIKDIKMHMRPSEVNPNIYYKITEIFEKK